MGRVTTTTDDSTDAADDRIRNPFAVGLRYAAIVLALFGVAAAFRMHRYQVLLPGADWRVIAAVPAGLVAACFGYAYLGAAVGARRAHTIAVVLLMIVLLGGAYALTRYMDARRG